MCKQTFAAALQSIPVKTIRRPMVKDIAAPTVVSNDQKATDIPQDRTGDLIIMTVWTLFGVVRPNIAE